MKSNEMKKDIRYIVTKGNDTFIKGDIISIDTEFLKDLDKDVIAVHNGGGWIDSRDCDLNETLKGIEVKFDWGFYAKKKEQLAKELIQIDKILKEN